MALDGVDQSFSEIAGVLKSASRVLFVTGAGVSADSGLPTYRGVGGLYEDQATADGMPIEQALSGDMFARRPEVTWKYLWQIGQACLSARPNRAHEVIAMMQRSQLEVWVLTQNIDGLHRAAGTSHLVEVHGNMFDLGCTDCGHLFSIDDFVVAGHHTLPPFPLRCRSCQGLVRPNVVLFGERLSPEVAGALFELNKTDFDLVVSVGTSSVFPYIVQPVLAAVNRGRPTVEINPAETGISGVVRHHIHWGAAEALERIWSDFGSHQADGRLP